MSEADRALDRAFALYDAGDFAAVLAILRPLADQGDVRAQGVLGVMYGLGQGVPRNYGVAWDLLYPSAQAGDPNAQYNLGTLYERGLGVLQDYSEAREWFLAAARQGVPEAQFALGVSFEEGLGVTVDLVQAWAWYDVAASQTHTRDVRDKAIHERDAVAAKLSSEQIAEARVRAADIVTVVSRPSKPTSDLA